MSRYIDADAYAAEMKQRQDALKELMDDAVAMDNWEMYDGLSREFSVFVEAKLTLDAMPTVDAVPVVKCRECKHNKGEKVWLDGEVTIDCDNGMGYPPPDWFCADGERKDGETEHGNTYSLGKIEMPKGAMKQIIADGERRTDGK